MARVESATDWLGGSIPAPQSEKLVALASLVALWGERMNLSGHRTAEAILEHLVLDALALRAQIRAVLPASTGQTIVDLGSGAGFPGLPIAIVEPQSSVELVDSRERRHYFQRTVCRDLDLPNVEPRLGRIEDLEPVRADLVVAQALAQVDQVIDWALVWTRPGGLVVIPGSETPPAPRVKDGLAATGTCVYETPAGRSRSLWWGQRAGSGSNAP
jgi:16S rRNA (guanine527-N7)-methyltransferase